MSAKTKWQEYRKIAFNGQDYTIWYSTEENIYHITKDNDKPRSDGGYHDLWAMLKAKFPPEYIFKLREGYNEQ